jgi:hypothetical protein
VNFFFAALTETGVGAGHVYFARALVAGEAPEPMPTAQVTE